MYAIYSLARLLDLPIAICEKFPKDVELELHPLDQATFARNGADAMNLHDNNVCKVRVVNYNNVMLMIATSPKEIGVEKPKQTIYILRPFRRLSMYSLDCSPNNERSLLTLLVKEKLVSRKFQSAILAFQKKEEESKVRSNNAEYLLSALARMGLIPNAEQAKALRAGGITNEALMQHKTKMDIRKINDKIEGKKKETLDDND